MSFNLPKTVIYSLCGGAFLASFLVPPILGVIVSAGAGAMLAVQLLKDRARLQENKLSVLKLNISARQYRSRNELTTALESVVRLALKVLPARAAELSLIDQETGQYHSAIVVGVPILNSKTGESLDVPLLFSGTELGRLRLSLRRALSKDEHETASLLGLQGSIAIISAEYTRELIKLKSISEESLRAKTGFLANLSHEIRGPLGIMLNAVDLVVEGHCGPITEDQTDSLGMVRSNGRHLLSLINDVLDYAKVEGGKLDALPVVIDVGEALEDIATLMRSQAHSKKHKLNCIPPTADLRILVDGRHLRQVLINLLTNAIKYTPEGGVIDLSAVLTKSQRVEIHVKDTGVGIADKDRGKVFAAFERIDDPYARKQLGTGLGMSLTKRLIELNHGTIDFDSSPGAGSDFYFSFPLTMEMPEEKASETQSFVINGGGRVVLVAAAEVSALKPIVRYLARLGFKIAYANSLVDIGNVLMAEPVQLFLVDDGWIEDEGAKKITQIRKEARGTRIPIVLISNRAFSFNVEDFLKIGVDRCLSQPLELNEIALVIDSLTRRRTGEVGKILGRLTAPPSL